VGLSIRGYARHRRVTHEAVRKALAAGRITAGADGTIDPATADRAWAATTAPRMNGQHGHSAPEAPPAGSSVLDSGAFQRARTAKSVIDAQRARLELDHRRGALITRDVAVHKAFSFARMLRDAWLTWPARVGPQLAADLGVDPAALIITLQELVRAHLEELARERCEF
jgi:hypothetical protein